jgi:hypothetical protein
MPCRDGRQEGFDFRAGEEGHGRWRFRDWMGEPGATGVGIRLTGAMMIFRR